MKKTMNIVIWVVALVALLAAAYTYYGKNKSLAVIPPTNSNTVAQGTPAQNAVSNETPISTDQSSSGGTSTEATANNNSSASTGTSTAGTGDTKKIMAPDFSLKDLEGNEVKLSDYRGKIVILNFWAVWCKYCKQEMPDLSKLNGELEKSGDAVLLAVDVQETEDVVKNYLNSNNINVKVLMDKDGSIAGTYGVEGYPTTFIVNSDGSLYTYIPGATNIDTLHTILDKVRNGEPLQ